ncbi:ferredoxin [Streptomyces verrucosisporus]|uniref:ferredoxin n=1 Tax=Streptomyces verrucosisporus TaxID=1695161 RepID=UPI0019D2DD5E|nr:ferredoxin [Streptomyces verrucosisporus]MBN3931896.1 ferredoxin [Streptomyces verrucosisporus]
MADKADTGRAAPGGRMLLSIDAAACTGAGTCEAMHPELFRVEPAGHAVVSRTELTDPADIEAATDVLDVCPTEAVRLTPADPAARA